MGVDTAKFVEATNTYNSICECRAKCTKRAGEVAPHCPTCRKPTKWVIAISDVVQRAHPAKPTPMQPS